MGTGKFNAGVTLMNKLVLCYIYCGKVSSNEIISDMRSFLTVLLTISIQSGNLALRLSQPKTERKEEKINTANL